MYFYFIFDLRTLSLSLLMFNGTFPINVFCIFFSFFGKSWNQERDSMMGMKNTYLYEIKMNKMEEKRIFHPMRNVMNYWRENILYDHVNVRKRTKKKKKNRDIEAKRKRGWKKAYQSSKQPKTLVNWSIRVN